MSNKYLDRTPVVNRRNIPRKGTYTYVGRGSPWGNPFKIGSFAPNSEPPKTMGRAAVIIEYFRYFIGDASSHHELVSLHTHDGVSCYCAPKACHGEVLTAFADAYRKFNVNPCPVIGADYTSIPHIVELPNPSLFYADETQLWQFSVGSHTDGFHISEAETVYEAIRGGLETYFISIVAQGKLAFPFKDEHFIDIERFLYVLTANGYVVCKLESGEYIPVVKDIIEWLQLTYGDNNPYAATYSPDTHAPKKGDDVDEPDSDESG